MSDITSLTSTRLEELPDEILLKVFKYVKSIDLHSFIGHNLRINNVIKDVQLNIVICPEEEEENLDRLRSFPPNQVIRLELNYEWDTFDINVFKWLRSLTINCQFLSENQLNQVSLISSYCLSGIAKLM